MPGGNLEPINTVDTPDSLAFTSTSVPRTEGFGPDANELARSRQRQLAADFFASLEINRRMEQES